MGWGGVGGKWSRAAVFSINSSSRKPPTTSSTPPAAKQEAAGKVIPPRQVKPNQAGSLTFWTPTQLTKVFANPPGEQEDTGQRVALCSLGHGLPFRGSPRDLNLLPTPTPLHVQAEALGATWQKEPIKKVDRFHPTPSNRLQGLPTKKAQLLSTVPCSPTSTPSELSNWAPLSPLEWEGWKGTGEVRTHPSSASWKALIC